MVQCPKEFVPYHFSATHVFRWRMTLRLSVVVAVNVEALPVPGSHSQISLSLPGLAGPDKQGCSDLRNQSAI